MSTYNKILKLAKKINSSKIPIESILSGLPQQIYSYNTKKIEFIGSHTYQGGFNRFLKTHFNEFSNPTSKYDSILSILQQYKSIVNGTNQDEYDGPCEQELKLIAKIADQLASNTKQNPSIESDSDLVLDQMFDYIDPQNLNANNWKGALLLQHPMSVHEMSDGPSVIMGINIESKWQTNPYNDEMVEMPHYTGIQLNKNAILELDYVLKQSYRTDKKYMIKTSNGLLLVPDMFQHMPLYHGGDDCIYTTNVLTTCRFCKGLPLLGGKFFLNPDLNSAERMIIAGHATVDEFRFFQGKMLWNTELFVNIMQQRNVYCPFMMGNKLPSDIVNQAISAIWTDDIYHQNDMQWTNILRFASPEWQQWIHIQNMMKTSTELNELKNLHHQSICKQVHHFQTRN